MKPTPVVITLLVLSKHLTEAVVDTEYYSLLGVDPSATDRDIRKAFKKLGAALPARHPYTEHGRPCASLF